MGLPSVLFFDARSLLEDSLVSSAPKILPSCSSDESIRSSEISSSTTTLAGDISVSLKNGSPQKPQYTGFLHPTARVPSQSAQVIPETQDEDRIHSFPTAKRHRVVSETLALEDALLWRPLHVLPHTAPRPKFCMDTPFDAASIRPALSHVRGLQRYHVQESVSQWPYGINPASLNKDLPELPTERIRGWGAFRRTISHLLQCRSKESIPAASPLASDQAIAPRALKTSKSALLEPSSASLVSRQNSSSSQIFHSRATAHIVDPRQSHAHIRMQQVRRSQSLSGCPNALSAVSDTQAPAADVELMADENEEMDDIAQEGFAILREVAMAWNIEPMTTVHDDPVADENEGMDQMTKDALEILGEIHKTWKFAPLRKDDPAFVIVKQDQLFQRGLKER